MATDTANLVTATWALVAATLGIGIFAIGVPAWVALRQWRAGRIERATRVVPELESVVALTRALIKEVESRIRTGRDYSGLSDGVAKLEAMLDGVIAQAQPLGLKCANELYAARNLLMGARLSFDDAPDGWLGSAKDAETSARAQTQLYAAVSSLEEAERLVPARRVGHGLRREDFRKRYLRLSTERMNAEGAKLATRQVEDREA
jgi:hypothetical protein